MRSHPHPHRTYFLSLFFAFFQIFSQRLLCVKFRLHKLLSHVNNLQNLFLFFCPRPNSNRLIWLQPTMWLWPMDCIATGARRPPPRKRPFGPKCQHKGGASLPLFNQNFSIKSRGPHHVWVWVLLCLWKDDFFPLKKVGVHVICECVLVGDCRTFKSWEFQLERRRHREQRMSTGSQPPREKLLVPTLFLSPSLQYAHQQCRLCGRLNQRKQVRRKEKEVRNNLTSKKTILCTGATCFVHLSCQVLWCQHRTWRTENPKPKKKQTEVKRLFSKSTFFPTISKDPHNNRKHVWRNVWRMFRVPMIIYFAWKPNVLNCRCFWCRLTEKWKLAKVMWKVVVNTVETNKPPQTRTHPTQYSLRYQVHSTTVKFQSFKPYFKRDQDLPSEKVCGTENKRKQRTLQTSLRHTLFLKISLTKISTLAHIFFENLFYQSKVLSF